MNNTVVVGSLSAVAKSNKTSIAESFVDVEAVVLIDVSGSMNTNDARDGQSRYDVAVQELGELQRAMPGEIAIIGFSSDAEFSPGGVPSYSGGSTDLAKALRLAKLADVAGVRFIVISDGQPNSEREALDVAFGFTAPIDTIFVGPETDTQGRDFLSRLAQKHQGRSVLASHAKELAGTVKTLLLA